MGVIQRQGMKRSIVHYMAIGLGAINLLFIYPYALQPEELGIIPFITSIAMMIVPFSLLGGLSLVIRFFPDFKDDSNGHNGFLHFLIGLGVVGFGIISFLAFIFRDGINSFYSDKSGLYLDYLPYVLPLVLLIGISQILSKYISNFKRIVIPFIISNVLIKIVLPVLVLSYFFKFISFKNVFNGLVLSYFFVVIGLLVYLKLLDELKFQFNRAFYKKDLRKRIFVYGSYGFLGVLGVSIISRIDLIMVGSMIDLKNVAIYAIAFFISDVIDVPRKSIEEIATPIVSQAVKDNNQDLIKQLYKKTALNQLIFGLFLFIIIWSCIDDFFQIMPNGWKYSSGKYVVLILGVASLIDLATGINSHIIGFSKYFRFNFYLILLLSVLNLLFNWLLIPVYFIYGAAMATLLSKSLYNIIKTLYAWRKLDMHPFSNKTIKVLLSGGFVFFLIYIFPVLNSPILNIFIKGVFFSLVYWFLILFLELSDDINGFYSSLIEFIKNKLKISK